MHACIRNNYKLMHLESIHIIYYVLLTGIPSTATFVLAFAHTD